MSYALLSIGNINSNIIIIVIIIGFYFIIIFIVIIIIIVVIIIIILFILLRFILCDVNLSTLRMLFLYWNMQ